ncbi:MAG: hypothetical protein M1821_005663 [Bathelium mastoideum]|nr:MAG: hypothetical protein M1821_005663 [Bathelium mastoideum]
MATNASDQEVALLASFFESPPPPPGVDMDGRLVYDYLAYRHIQDGHSHDQREGRPKSKGLARDADSQTLPSLDSTRFQKGTACDSLPTANPQHPPPQPPRINTVRFRSLLAYLNPWPTADAIPNFLRPDLSRYFNFRRGLLTIFLGWLEAQTCFEASQLDAVLFYTIDRGRTEEKAQFGLGVLHEAIAFEVGVPAAANSQEVVPWTVLVLVEKAHPGHPHDTSRRDRVAMDADANLVNQLRGLNMLGGSSTAPERSETPWHLVAFPSECIHTSWLELETPQWPPQRSSSLPEVSSNSALIHNCANSRPDILQNRGAPGQTASQRVNTPMQQRTSGATEANSRPAHPPTYAAVAAAALPAPLRITSSSSLRHNSNEGTPNHAAATSSAAYPYPRMEARRTCHNRIHTRGRMPLMEGSGIREEYWREWMMGCLLGEVGIVWWEGEQRGFK